MLFADRFWRATRFWRPFPPLRTPVPAMEPIIIYTRLAILALCLHQTGHILTTKFYCLHLTLRLSAKSKKFWYTITRFSTLNRQLARFYFGPFIYLVSNGASKWRNAFSFPFRQK